MKIRLPIALLLLLVLSCNNGPELIPRPRAYPRILFPDKTYITFEQPGCPFTFDYPGYGIIEAREPISQELDAHSCWFDIHMPSFNARLHCSYHAIGSAAEFDDYVNDAFKIANRISQRANYMNEYRVANTYGTGGLIFEFDGPAASPMHFFLTDSTSHFMKAALYFNTQVRPDSLAPITEFIKDDIAFMINSFLWH